MLLVLLLASGPLLTACAVAPSGTSPPGPVEQGSPDADGKPASVELAARLVGSPYHYGGASPAGFDCSGLVYYTFNRAGIDVPRTTSAQYRYSTAVNRDQLQPGDLVFFKLNSRKVSHVGIYAGNGRFIHAPSSGKRVSYAYLQDPYWRARTVGFRRVR